MENGKKFARNSKKFETFARNTNSPSADCFSQETTRTTSATQRSVHCRNPQQEPSKSSTNIFACADHNIRSPPPTTPPLTGNVLVLLVPPLKTTIYSPLQEQRITTMVVTTLKKCMHKSTSCYREF